MVEAAFDKVAKVYDETIPVHIRDYYLAKRLKFIQGVLENGSILDVACGTGLLDYHLEKLGYRVVGSDISQEMLKEASTRGCARNICSPATSLPFKSESFDLVISVAALHHFAERITIYEALREMLRVLKQSGALLLWDHNPLNPYWPILMKRLPQDKGVKRTIPLSEIVDNINRIGSYRIIVRRLGFMPDFIPKFFLKPFEILEKIIENSPLLNKLCAHNVVVIKKG